ncbi:cytochrome c peroxidase [Bradyrhizobium sp. LTSP857]|uniref:cytochrome-c peroxidase n=1 Tax=Bradyrhizobium sp. LTSP857 TaxID=1619231 RepID=UPI000AE7E6B2|nr:cytochrome c peroxidase [Bradyrhizobium sp. LTSP857]
MPTQGSYRSRLFIATIASATLGILGFATIGFGAAVVGESRKVEITQKGSSGLDALKAQYRRPATIPFPKDNPYTPEKSALGKKLYFDTRLSVTSAQSCASCHSPGFGWGDGLAVGVGHGMAKLGRRSPTIVNAAWSAIYMWDGRLPTLEDQALGPIQSPGEMNMKLDQLMERLASIPEYRPMFDATFPGQGMKPATLAQAIATYERTVVSERAPFDAWIEGNEKAISEEAKRGFAVFNGKAQCAACHEGWNFTNEGFQDIGLLSTDIGRGEYLPGVIKMQHAFKTPGLREITRRGPFMHDGSLATLEAVIDHYDHAGVDRPSRSDLIVRSH